MTLFLRAHHGQIESNSRDPKARAEKILEILIENCEEHPVLCAHYLIYSRYRERLLSVTNELILSALPAHERRTFASAEGASGEKSDFDRESRRTSLLFAPITSLSQGILNACYHKWAHFERASRL